MFEGFLRTVETNVVRMCLAYALQIILIVCMAQANGDDHQSLGATLIREVERNKLSARERSWVAGTM
jgi:hypothetical protein